jgi:hypothetical protein
MFLRQKELQSMTIYRQGDVLLVKQDDLPDNAKPATSEAGRIVLAYGEVTGHAHAIDGRLATLYSAGNQRFVQAEEGATLTHEEHASIALETGVYEVIRQREYTPSPARSVYVRD